MQNRDFINVLNSIKNFIEEEEYEKALENIELNKAKLLLDEDPASKYIDNLVNDMK